MPDPGGATIANRPGEDAVFFGDSDPGAVRGFEPDRATNDARLAWVDARLGFPLHPQWGTAFGGVATSSRRALPLPLAAAGTSLLALTDGTLRDGRGSLVATAASDLHWWPLPAGAASVVCRGTCVVALQGRVPAALPEHRSLAPDASSRWI